MPTVRDIIYEYIAKAGDSDTHPTGCTSPACGSEVHEGICDYLTADCDIGFKGPSTDRGVNEYDEDYDWEMYPTHEAADAAKATIAARAKKTNTDKQT